MKNSTLLFIVMFFGAVANAQTTTPPQTTSTDSTFLVDTSIGKAYVSRPERLVGLTTETLTAAHIFPALGNYQASGTSTGDVTIVLDEQNKGMVWVEGLPQGRFKAIMKKAPSTYKIPAQKSDSGKSIAEGTLYVNPETNELNIVLGRPFNDSDPTSFLTVSTKKKSAWKYTGVKAEAETAVAAPAVQQ